jgi:hypothetical protein
LIDLQVVCAALEDQEEWDTNAVKIALKKIIEIRGPIMWCPLLESRVQEWEAMVAGAAAAAGIQVEHTLRVAKDVVKGAEEKGVSLIPLHSLRTLNVNKRLLADKANKRGRTKKIVASTMDDGDLHSLFLILTDHFEALAEQGERQEGSLLTEDDLRGVFGEDGNDMGVTAFKDKTYEELST